ncbi:MAG: AraC family transcriptional regulator [Cellulophaga sp.]
MKIYPFKIPKPQHNNLIIQIDKQQEFYNKLHQHEEIQISFLLKGNGSLIIADSIHTYTEGDLFIIGSNIPHVFQSNTLSKETSHMVSLFFTPASFGNDFFNLIEFNELRPFFQNAKTGFKVKSIPERITENLQQLKNKSKFNRFVFLIDLLHFLSYAETKALTSFIYPKEITVSDGERIQTIFDYAITNFHRNITLKTISGIANMTPHSFCRYFKQRTNKTFFQFLIELRIANACKLLRHKKDIPIEDISYLSGFKNLSNFNRKFKEFKKTTPNNYRHNRIKHL